MRGDEILPSLPRRIYMGLTTATAAWLIAATTAASAGVSAVQQHQANKQAQAQAKEAEQTAQKQAQVQAEQAPELSAEVGTSEAVKKRRTSYGIQDSILAQNNTVGQKETWG